mmetsp:Transcript_29587/g.73300  ORF Transcript_29587/g.73300 Transcript_29587/m.73300 type:complete len:375 (+) Transcript_29587:701-1825(+)
MAGEVPHRRGWVREVRRLGAHGAGQLRNLRRRAEVRLHQQYLQEPIRLVVRGELAEVADREATHRVARDHSGSILRQHEPPGDIGEFRRRQPRRPRRLLGRRRCLALQRLAHHGALPQHVVDALGQAGLAQRVDALGQHVQRHVQQLLAVRVHPPVLAGVPHHGEPHPAHHLDARDEHFLFQHPLHAGLAALAGAAGHVAPHLPPQGAVGRHLHTDPAGDGHGERGAAHRLGHRAQQGRLHGGHVARHDHDYIRQHEEVDAAGAPARGLPRREDEARGGEGPHEVAQGVLMAAREVRRRHHFVLEIAVHVKQAGDGGDGHDRGGDVAHLLARLERHPDDGLRGDGAEEERRERVQRVKLALVGRRRRRHRQGLQ